MWVTFPTRTSFKVEHFSLWILGWVFMIGLSKPAASIAAKKGACLHSSTALVPVVKLAWPLCESVQLANPAENYSFFLSSAFLQFEQLKQHAGLSDKWYSGKGKTAGVCSQGETCLFGGSKQLNELSCPVKPELHKQPCNLRCDMRNPLSIEESL